MEGFFHLEIVALFSSHGSSFTQRFFHLEIMASSSSHGSNFTQDTFSTLGSNSSSSSSVDEMIHEMFANIDRQR